MKFNLILLVGVGVIGCSRPVDDEEAIKQVLEKESATWRSGDVPGHAACWHIQPYSRVLISTTDGKVLDVPPAVLVKASPAMGQGGHAVNTNYKMRVSDSMAWVSHDEESTAKNGQKTYSHEIRLLEKLGGDWKLVGQSIHLYTP